MPGRFPVMGVLHEFPPRELQLGTGCWVCWARGAEELPLLPHSSQLPVPPRQGVVWHITANCCLGVILALTGRLPLSKVDANATLSG